MSSFIKGVVALPSLNVAKDTTMSTGSSASTSGHGMKRRGLQSLGAAWSGIKRRAIGAASPLVCRLLPGESALAAASQAKTPIPFSALVDGPYFEVASWLDAADLARTDAVCHMLSSINGQPHGPWQSIGMQRFFGMELDVREAFVAFAGRDGWRLHGDGKAINWKAHYKTFHSATPTFSAPFRGQVISKIERPDEVAYCRCRLRSDLLTTRSDMGAYVEVEIRANADNLSLAVVDFEGGGRSSVTFSPETGAVLREQKVREAPRAIEGTYIHLLPAAPPGHRFEGRMGLYLKNGQLAFFRKWSSKPLPLEDDETGLQPPVQDDANQEPAWETTGFCTDMTWAFGPRLSLCLAFRDPGAYHVEIVKVGDTPPIAAPMSETAYKHSSWSHLYGDDDHPLAI